MAYTKDIPAETDVMQMGPELGSMCGDNAMNWSRAFCAVAKSKGIDLGDDPEGWMVGWFANAIECAHFARHGSNPIILPDGSGFAIIEGPTP